MRPWSRVFALAVAICCVAGCAAVSRSTSFPEQMARESAALGTVAVGGDGGGFSTVIEGRLARPLQPLGEGSGVSMVIDIGASRPVECQVFLEDLDLASALLEFSRLSFEEIEKRNGPVISKRIQNVSADAIGLAAHLAISWRYRAGPGVGLIKHRIASVDGGGLYCRHIETGYRRTFERVFDSIARNLRWPGRAPRAVLYEAVSRVDVDAKPRGIEKVVVTDTGDGTLRSERRTSMLVSSPYGAFSSVDTVTVGFSKPDGTLINSVYARSRDGELVANLSLGPSEDGWVISDLLRDREIVDLEYGDQALSSTPGQIRELRDAMRRRGASNSFEVHGWYPRLVPERLARRVVVVGERRGEDHFEVLSKINDVLVESVVDLNGHGTWSRRVDRAIGLLETKLLHTRGRLDVEPEGGSPDDAE